MDFLNTLKNNNSKFVDIDAPLVGEDAIKFNKVLGLFTNNGAISEIDPQTNTAYYGKVTFQDTIMSGDLLRFVPKVVTYLLRAGVEPRMVIANNLFKQVSVNQMIQVDVGYFGSLDASEQPEGKDWKESYIEFNGGKMIQPVQYRRIGVQFRITSQAKQVGGFDIIRLLIDEAGKALVRYKEKLCMDAIDVQGVTLFDNTTPANSEFGNATGRNITGAFNGTMTLNDLIAMYSYLTMREGYPDTLLMNPLAWMVFATSPETKEIVLNGNQVVSAPIPDGAAGGIPNVFGPFGLNTESGQGTSTPDSVFGKIGINPFVTSLSPYSATFQSRSNYFPTGLNIIVTPFVKFTLNAGTVAANTGLPATDIVMVDSNKTGVIIATEKPQMKTYDDFFTEASIFRIGETYATEIIYQGQYIGVARNIIIDRNYNFENVNNVTITAANPGNTKLV